MCGEFKFFPVGQGLFYGGIIHCRQKEGTSKCFSVVYDCGVQQGHSKTNLYKSINEFRKQLVNNTLDLLIISHFHYDHISGISDLLKGLKVNNIVVPHFNTLEEKLALLDNESLTLYFRDPIYRNIVNDISTILDSTNETKIIEIANEQSGENNVSDEIDLNNIKAGKTSCNLLKFSVLSSFWSFYFYNPSYNLDDLTTYKKEIELISEKYKDKINTKLPFDENEVKEVVFRLNNLIPTGKRNEHSLIVYHAPKLGQDMINYCNYYHECLWNNGRNIYQKTGTLLTGDYEKIGALLTNDNEQTEEKMQSLKAKFGKNAINNIVVFLVPHHGSANVDLTSKDYIFPFSVISYRSKSKGKHPAESTMRELSSSTTSIVLVNQDRCFCYILHK